MRTESNIARGNRKNTRTYRVLMCVLACAGLAVTPGCALWETPRVVSPWSGRQVTDAELAAEHAAKLRDLAAEDAAERERIDAEARAARREFDAAVATLDLTQQQALIDLRSRFDGRAAEIDALRIKQDRERDTEAAMIAQRLREGRAQIARAQERQDFLGGLLATVAGNPATSAAVSAIPIVGPILTGVMGYAVAGSASRRRKQAEDAAWDEAKREAREEQARNDATWDQSAAAQQQQALLAALLSMSPLARNNTQTTQTEPRQEGDRRLGTEVG